MQTIKTILMAATALTLMSGAALAAGGNEAYTTQTGTGADATINQTLAGDSWADTNQTGSGNSLTVLQSGSNQTVGTRDFIDSGDVQQSASGNILQIMQSGASNTVAKASQASDDNYLSINQEGEGNSLASARQTGEAGDEGNFAQLSFVGNNNGTSTALLANGRANNELVQVGSDNTVLASFAGNSNNFRIEQAGSANVLSSSIGGNGNLLDVTQWGAGHEGYVSASGADSNSIYTQQYGQKNTFNVALIPGADGNQLIVFQGEGSSNNTANLYSATSGNFSEIIQNGTGNTATIDTTEGGGDNVASTYQENSSNTVSVYQ